MRWYDLNPSVCMAISLIELKDYKTQSECARFIIERAKERDKGLTFIKNAAFKNINEKHFRRWYDKNESVSLAFKYLRELPSDVQISIAEEVLEMFNRKAAV